MVKYFDDRCLSLARVFLADSNLSGDEKLESELARDLQETAERFIEYHENFHGDKMAVFDVPGLCVWCGAPSDTKDDICPAPDGNGHLFR